MTRVHVRLLGPCFKTGQADHTVLRLRFLSRAEIPQTDNQRIQHATVARPHIARTLLVRSIDRVKRLLVKIQQPQKYSETEAQTHKVHSQTPST
jgi:hypothetical protein